MSSQVPLKRRPGRPKEPEKRDHLLRVSRGIFAARGYDGARLQQIADAAGLSKPALFHHFSSKDVLYEAVLDDMMKELAAYVYASSSEEGSYVKRLKELAYNLADYFGAHPEAAKLLLREFVNDGPYTSSRGKALVQNTLKTAVAFIQSGTADGSFVVHEPERVVLAAAGEILFYYGAHQLSAVVLGTDALNESNLSDQRDAIAEHFCRLVRASE